MDTTDRSLTNGRWELPTHARGVQSSYVHAPRRREREPSKLALGALALGVATLPLIVREAVANGRDSRGLAPFLRRR